MRKQARNRFNNLKVRINSRATGSKNRHDEPKTNRQAKPKTMCSHCDTGIKMSFDADQSNRFVMAWVRRCGCTTSEPSANHKDARASYKRKRLMYAAAEAELNAA